MKKTKIIAIALAAVIAAGCATAGGVYYYKNRTVNFGEIVIDGIPKNQPKQQESCPLMSVVPMTGKEA